MTTADIPEPDEHVRSPTAPRREPVTRERDLLADGGGDGHHSAITHKWVIRTSKGDEMAASTRLKTSWPLLWKYSARQFKLRYRQSAVGVFWTVVQPVAIVAIYGFVFSAFLEVDGGDHPYLSVAWIGITVWMYVQAVIQAGCVSLLGDAWLLGRVWFPREISPLAPAVVGLIDLAVASAIMAVIVVLQGGGPSFKLVTVPFILVVLILWVSAISIISATITIFFRDMATIMSLLLRLLFVATPVMYPAETIPVQFGWVNWVNPFAAIVNNMRAVILGKAWPNWEVLTLHLLLGAGLCWLGIKYLRAVERSMVDII